MGSLGLWGFEVLGSLGLWGRWGCGDIGVTWVAVVVGMLVLWGFWGCGVAGVVGSLGLCIRLMCIFKPVRFLYNKVTIDTSQTVIVYNSPL